METYLVSSPNPTAGLCNRIFCLVSCLRLSEINSSKVALKWQKNDRFNCNFEDLFENKLIDASTINSLHQGSKKIKYVNTWRLLFSLDKIHSTNNKITNDFLGDEYETVSLENRNKFLPYFNLLQPTHYIENEVNSFAKNFNENTISMALRTWEQTESRQHLFKLDRVKAIIDANPNSTFFISCDSETTLNEIKNSYGKRILHYPSRTVTGDRNSTEGIQDALIDVLLLSKNTKLKASRLSTFSEAAWWFGQCKADVQII